MSKKVSNPIASHISSKFALDDRITYNQLSYHFGEFIKHCKWSANQKLEKQERIDQIVQDGHTFDSQTGAQIEPDWVQLDNDRQWYEDQKNVTLALIDILQAASEEMFQATHKKARSQADALKRLKKLAG